MDVLWFRLPRRSGDPRDQITFYVGGGLFIFLLDRGEEWQVGYGLMKGKFAETKAAGLEALRLNLVIQRFQGLVQERVVKAALNPDRPFRLPGIARVILKIPKLRDIAAQLIAFGLRRPLIQN